MSVSSPALRVSSPSTVSKREPEAAPGSFESGAIGATIRKLALTVVAVLSLTGVGLGVYDENFLKPQRNLKQNVRFLQDHQIVLQRLDAELHRISPEDVSASDREKLAELLSALRTLRQGKEQGLPPEEYARRILQLEAETSEFLICCGVFPTREP